MEPREHQEHDEPVRSARAPGPAGPEAQVVGTDDPQSGPAHRAADMSEPDRNMVVQTSRIREPNQAFSPNWAMVPVEAGPPAIGNGMRSESRSPFPEARTSRRTSSCVLLFSAAVALVCGAAGAWGYSHFFGPDKSGDEKSASKESGSGKESSAKKRPRTTRTRGRQAPSRRRASRRPP